MVRLPAGRQFALTWGIPDDFGGMTSALLHRSRAFVRLARTPVDILTFDGRPDYPAVEARLRESGELIDGMRVVNLWDWFREHVVPTDVAGTLDLESHPFTPLDVNLSYSSTWRGDRELSRTRFAPDGATPLQVDYFRLDGTLVVSDRRDAAVRGEHGGRSVVLCDAVGNPVRSWGSVWAIYRLWLDLVRDREPSYLIVDSKTVANFAQSYRRKRAVVIHLVHNSHLQGDIRPIGPLRESRRAVFENLAALDAVAVLTKRQKSDVVELLGPTGNLHVVPNGRDLGAPKADVVDRAVGEGIVLASLTPRKRVDHAIRAAIDAATRSENAVTLDVFGKGPEREALDRLLVDSGSEEIVTLRGHDPKAREHLRHSSFILQTGRTEGFPLVLVEAMAAGCIPIAYDVPYGAADIIRHRRNGFLVESGNEEALAEAILAMQRMPKRSLAAMRRRAVKTAAAFSDSKVTETWARVMHRADSAKRAVWELNRKAG